jgi:hypothetical protein
LKLDGNCGVVDALKLFGTGGSVLLNGDVNCGIVGAFRLLVFGCCVLLKKDGNCGVVDFWAWSAKPLGNLERVGTPKPLTDGCELFITDGNCGTGDGLNDDCGFCASLKVNDAETELG